MPAKQATRGQTKLRKYLEEKVEGTGPVRTGPKTAQDVVPVLKERAEAPAQDGVAATAIDSTVVQHLQKHAAGGAVNRLSQRQLKLVQALASFAPVAADAAATAPFRVRRSMMKSTAELVDTVAVAALQRAALARAAGRVDLTDSSLLVLVETDAAAAVVKSDLQKRYGVTVLDITDGNEERYPTFPLSPAGRAPSARAASKTPKKATKGKKSKEEEVNENTPAAGDFTDLVEALECAVVVATPKGFLAVEKRSAIWKFIGAYVVAATEDPKQSAAAFQRILATRPKAANTSATSTSSSSAVSLAVQLCEQRWGCLGHATVAAVLSLHEAPLVNAALDWLLTLQPTAGATTTTGTTATKTAASGSLPKRRPVTVHYTESQGIHRFGFLFSLIRSIAPHGGIVVHFATKEACAFMYNALYAMLDDLPSYLRLLTDYEGEGEFSASVASTEDRHRLCQEFNNVVTDATETGAAVLLSCYGLVPTRGRVFVMYDVIPDVVNFGQFVADVLTPRAYPLAAEDAAAAEREEKEEGTKEGPASRKRGRAVSPTPRGKKPASKGARGKESEDEDEELPPMPAMYEHIIVLLRPNEVQGALGHLRRQQARFQLTYAALPQKPSLSSYLLHCESLKTMHKKLFVVANAAYHAYKATMTAYCTVGPRDVYNESKADLEKISEEFGFTELPLLDLRMKDTVFRPKEDLYKAAKQKQLQQRVAYKKFVDENIIGEGPEEHIVESHQ